jgi:murein DD-endopeptidase MepM/ murein hydrolase activator NlpD
MIREDAPHVLLPTQHRSWTMRRNAALGAAFAIAFVLAATPVRATGPAVPLSGGALAASSSMLAAIGPALRESAAPPNALLAALSEPHDRVVEGRIEPKETLAKALARQGIAATTASLITRQLRPQFDFRRTRPGHQYRLTLDPRGAVASFHYKVSKNEHYWLERDGKRWRAWREESDVRREQKKITGTVATSLSDAIEGIGGDNARLAQDFAGIFAWDLDFSRGVQPGDEFRILYEHAYAPQGKGRERSLGPGRILAAKYQGGGGELAAIYYETEPGRGGYFRPDGTSVQGQFLAAPLNFSRITSSFTHARFHPILRRTRPHPGIDYAAPTGTPVWSVANGVVSYAGWMSGYGRLVKIKHADGYESYYAHLSRFANALRVGQAVRQKQVIGFVGSSGLSTGPHVCFRVTRNGQYVNPLRVQIGNETDRIPKSQWTAFKAVRDRRLSELGPAPIVPTNSAM